MDETTYNKYQFSLSSETNESINDGIVTVTMSGNYPDTQKNSFPCYADLAIREADAYVQFASFDNDANGTLG